MLVCPEGHEMLEGERFCRRCGAEVAPERDSGAVVLPALGAFDADRLRGRDLQVAGRTVSVAVLVIVVLAALAVGVMLGAMS